MKKIKILHLIKSLGRGGAEMLLPETLRLHDKNKFEFHYIYFLPWKNQMVEEIEKNEGRVKCIEAQNNIQLLSKTVAVIEYCRKNEIELVHAHLPWSGLVGRLIYKKTNIPLLYTEHNIQERYHLATKLLNKWTFNWQSFAIGVSEDVTESIKKNINPSIPVDTILNGVNTSKFLRDNHKGKRIREELNIPFEAIVIGNIAVFREQKDLKTWILAFKQIQDRNPKVYGLLVGAGPKEAELKELINQLEIKNLYLPGLQKDTVSYFSAMDIFMMTSKFEGLPIALLEAMSMECAIVSTKAGGVVEVIENEKQGFLADVGDQNKLVESCNSLIEKPEMIIHLGKNARRRIKENFSLANMVCRLENQYLSLTSNEVIKKESDAN